MIASGIVIRISSGSSTNKEHTAQEHDDFLYDDDNDITVLTSIITVGSHIWLIGDMLRTQLLSCHQNSTESAQFQPYHYYPFYIYISTTIYIKNQSKTILMLCR